jgi:SOS response associated peptidase (SRAP)
MCGRYTINIGRARFEQVYAVQAPLGFTERFNVAPMQPAPIIRAGTDRLEAVMLPWGIRRAGSVQPLINARGETVAHPPTFASSFRSRRCLVPTMGVVRVAEGRHGQATAPPAPRERRTARLRGHLDAGRSGRAVLDHHNTRLERHAPHPRPPTGDPLEGTLEGLVLRRAPIRTRGDARDRRGARRGHAPGRLEDRQPEKRRPEPAATPRGDPRPLLER